MGYIVEYRDENHYEEVMDKMRKAKKAVCDAWESLSEMDGEVQERSYGGYRGGGRTMYRGGRDEYDDDMNMRRGRDSHGRYM